jgi:hypothetical protein
MGRPVFRAAQLLASARAAERAATPAPAPARRVRTRRARTRTRPVVTGVATTLAFALTCCATACTGGSGQPAAGTVRASASQSTQSGSSTNPGRPSTPSGSAGPTGATTALTTPVTPPQTHPAGPKTWQPAPGLTWQWQLTEPVDTGVNAEVYDIDSVDNSAAVVAKLHAAGRKVICYVNAGAYEDFRPDAAEFPARLLGQSDGWPGEKWLDIRELTLLRPIMAARFAVCAQKGFDAVEADNVDGYQNDSGFPLTAADQLAYDRMLAGLAHADGLAIGLKNDLDQIPQLLPSFDFAVDEQCAEYSECGALEPFIRAGKAVFEAEYNLPLSQFCGRSVALGFSAILKDTDLDATRQACPAASG